MISNVQKLLRKRNIDLAFFMSSDGDSIDTNLVYLTGYKGIGALLVPAKKRPVLLVPNMEYERAKKESSVPVMRFTDSLAQTISHVATKKNYDIETIGFDMMSTPALYAVMLKKIFKKALQENIFSDMMQLRLHKTDEEIAIIKKGCQITDDIIASFVKNFSTFKTEKDVDTFLRIETLKRGCGLSFDPIVASGVSSSFAHYEPQEKKITKGFLLIDFGIMYKGYCTDMTRTFYVGTPSKEEKKLYNNVLFAQMSAIEQAKEGVLLSSLYEHVCTLFGKEKKYFPYSLGHGVGMQVHEQPVLSPKSLDKLKNNTVFTIEPGIHYPDKYGVRIEDTLVLQNSIVTSLTQFPKKLICLGGTKK